MYAQPSATTPSIPAPKPEESESNIATLSVAGKIPSFWPENPRLWFCQVEAILAPQKTSDANKYFMVVAKLSKDAIQQVADILANPPENNMFETLKKSLLQIYEESEARQVRKLVTEIELGDQKPSQLLRRMKELARGKIEDETLKILWQSHLPASVQAVLTVTSTKDLEELAVIADKIMDTHQPVQISEVARSQPQPSTSFEVATIMAEIAKINLKISEIEGRRSRFRSGSRNRFRNYSRDRSQSRPRRTPESPDWLCPYHFRFRERAYRCVTPCSWKNKTQEPAREN